MSDKEKSTSEGLQLLREPFKDNQIGKLPKPTKKQTDEVKKDFAKGTRCTICGGWHHPKVVHLDYVGHAALTDRLLDVDPEWNWEPLSVGEDGLPQTNGAGLWIKLTVLGVTRIGFGDAQGKSGGNAIKEMIGDALRNAGMRFGLALDLWHKGDLHIDDDPEGTKDDNKGDQGNKTNPEIMKRILDKISCYTDRDKFNEYLEKYWSDVEFALKDSPGDFKKATAAMETKLSNLTAEKL